MKLRFFFLTVLFVYLSGCTAVIQPRLQDLVIDTEDQLHGCAAVFPDGNWQFAHSIDFTMGSGSGTPVIGVTNLAGDDFDVALVTVEGLTLFDAVFYQDGTAEIRRAVSPFDGPDFANGLINDIRAIFQPPAGSMTMGQIAGTKVCRYTDSRGQVVDVLPDMGDCWQIKSYTSDQKIDRSIIGQSCKQKESYLVPDYLELKTYGQAGYTLKLTLITADKLI